MPTNGYNPPPDPSLTPPSQNPWRELRPEPVFERGKGRASTTLVAPTSGEAAAQQLEAFSDVATPGNVSGYTPPPDTGDENAAWYASSSFLVPVSIVGASAIAALVWWAARPKKKKRRRR